MIREGGFMIRGGGFRSGGGGFAPVAVAGVLQAVLKAPFELLHGEVVRRLLVLPLRLRRVLPLLRKRHRGYPCHEGVVVDEPCDGEPRPPTLRSSGPSGPRDSIRRAPPLAASMCVDAPR
eukprot:8818701-Pyramimonas_sp.AAC.2